jgi:hypothetical protein
MNRNHIVIRTTTIYFFIFTNLLQVRTPDKDSEDPMRDASGDERSVADHSDERSVADHNANDSAQTAMVRGAVRMWHNIVFRC